MSANDKVLCKKSYLSNFTPNDNYRILNIYNSGGELYYHIGLYWFVVKTDKQPVEFPIFNDYFYNEKEIRKIKLQKINKI